MAKQDKDYEDTFLVLRWLEKRSEKQLQVTLDAVVQNLLFHAAAGMEFFGVDGVH